jgi:D-sedoheptulose 7-phosphate isomerase
MDQLGAPAASFYPISPARLEARIRAQFESSAATKRDAVAAMAVGIARAVEVMVSALNGGHKILACGNGGSAGDCQHFAAELVGRFER